MSEVQLGLQGVQDQLELQESLDQQAQQAPRERLELLDQLVHLVLRAQPGLQDRLGRPDQQEVLAALVPREVPVQQVPRVPLGQLVLPVLQDQVVQLAALELRVLQGRPDQLVVPEPQAALVRQARPVLLVLRVLKVQPVHPDQQARLAPREAPDRQVPLELRE